ncbi:MAG: DMT family transporter [Pseudomonadota bacterium]
MTRRAPPDNLRGGVWLIADLSLNIWALAIVKSLGLAFPAVQLVFLRSLVGLFLIAPLAWRNRHIFAGLPDRHLHFLRIALSAVTLSASFFAIAKVPLATFTAVGFTRPIVTMVMAATLLGEPIGPRRWIAAAIAFLGVLIALGPTGAVPPAGALGLAVTVLAGSAAIIVTRRLQPCPEIVLMLTYTAGLAAITLPFALALWVPPSPGEWVPLIAIGCFAQAAQFCFLRAHHLGQAGFLSVLSYLSLVLSVGVGVLVFGEVPDARFFAGAALVISAALWVAIRHRSTG